MSILEKQIEAAIKDKERFPEDDIVAVFNSTDENYATFYYAVPDWFVHLKPSVWEEALYDITSDFPEYGDIRRIDSAHFYTCDEDELEELLNEDYSFEDYEEVDW